jgi:ketosteroid isomerase-like protein
MDVNEVTREFWRRIEARDWDALRELLSEDVVVEWPNARLRIRGRANFVEFNRTYPEGWSIEVLRIVADGNTAVSEVRVPHPEIGPHYALSFLEIEGGLVKRAREYWVEERPEEPSPERARWFERM